MLNLDFIIEAQIQAPKGAHTKFSLIKNMHAAITFQFNILPLSKNIYWLTIQTFSCYALKMYAIYMYVCPKLLHHLCSQSKFTKLFTQEVFFIFFVWQIQYYDK